jgi:hypothetical protein
MNKNLAKKIKKMMEETRSLEDDDERKKQWTGILGYVEGICDTIIELKNNGTRQKQNKKTGETKRTIGR